MHVSCAVLFIALSDDRDFKVLGNLMGERYV